MPIAQAYPDAFDQEVQQTLALINQRKGQATGREQLQAESTGKLDKLPPEQVPVTGLSLTRGVRRALRASPNPEARAAFFPEQPAGDYGGGTVTTPATVTEKQAQGIIGQEIGLGEKVGFEQDIANEIKRRGLKGKEAFDFGVKARAEAAGKKAEVTEKARQAVQLSGLDLSPKAIHLAAQMVMAGTPIGQAVPGWGTAGARQRSQVFNLVADELDQAGHSGQALTLRQSALKSNQVALSWNKRQAAGILTFEKTVRRQFKLIEEQAKKVPRTKSPLYNTYAQWLSTRVAGDPETQGLFNLIATTTAEYSKVMTGNIGATASTDAAREAANRLLAAAFSPEQLSRSMELMQQEMDNRRYGLENEATEIEQEISQPMTGTVPRGIEYPQSSEPPPQVHDTLPDPSLYANKYARDTVTGERYLSDGKNWNKVK